MVVVLYLSAFVGGFRTCCSDAHKEKVVPKDEMHRCDPVSRETNATDRYGEKAARFASTSPDTKS